MANTILTRLQSVTSLSSNILRFPIQCLLHPRKALFQDLDKIFLPKTVITIFFTSKRLLVLNALLKDNKFNQDYFINSVLPRLYNEKFRISRRKELPNFSVHMNNFM